MQGCQAEGSKRALLLVDISDDHKHSKDHSITITVFFSKVKQTITRKKKNPFDLYMSPSVKGNLKYILGNGNAMYLKELNLVVAETPVLVMNSLLNIVVNEQY